MIFERTVKQTFEAIQFDGTNLREVYDFICEHKGNANNVSFEDLQGYCRPKEIPLDVNSSLECHWLQEEFNEKWGKTYKAWKSYKHKHPNENMEEHPEMVPTELIEELKTLRFYYNQDWRKGELYHFILNHGENCRLIGICKGDWFTTGGDPIDNYSEERFKSLCEDNGWQTRG